MTNAMWLREGSSMLQLLPFGWNLSANRVHVGRQPSRRRSEQVIRGHLYARMAETNNCTHHFWINENPLHAFFQGCTPHLTSTCHTSSTILLSRSLDYVLCRILCCVLRQVMSKHNREHTCMRPFSFFLPLS